MNKQYKSPESRGIEWTQYTWNPVSGCKHGCRWTMPNGDVAECYAETVANGVAGNAYPHGFEHHYWNPERLKEPFKLKEPSKIFLDSMSDLMGHWVPENEIQQVLNVCEQTPQHTYQLLTKNAPRLERFQFPPNVWVGVSVPPTTMFGKDLSKQAQVQMLYRSLEALDKCNATTRWMSLEPLSWDMAEHLQYTRLHWAVIGAATYRNVIWQPRHEWVKAAIDVLDKMGAAVFFKGNLKHNRAATPWREEFPVAPEKRPLVQQAMF